MNHWTPAVTGSQLSEKVAEIAVSGENAASAYDRMSKDMMESDKEARTGCQVHNRVGQECPWSCRTNKCLSPCIDAHSKAIGAEGLGVLSASRCLSIPQVARRTLQ